MACTRKRVTRVNMGGVIMKKILVIVCSAILAIGVAGCAGKAPVGKGKAPVVHTKG